MGKEEEKWVKILIGDKDNKKNKSKQGLRFLTYDIHVIFLFEKSIVGIVEN